MSDLGILKDVGLKEVARRTHIEPDFLQAIIYKDFERLHRLNVSGYIKILQREYSINLDDWLAEFEEYKKNHISSSNKPKVNPKIPAYTANGEPAKKLSGGSLGWILWFFILVVFLVAAYYFDIHKYIEQLPEAMEDKNTSAISYTNATVVQEVKKSMNIVEQNTTSVIFTKDKNTSVEISIHPNGTEANIVEVNTTKIDDNSSFAKVGSQIAKEDVNTSNTQQVTMQESIKEENTNEEISVGTFIAKAKSAEFVLKARIWHGVIDLKTGKKISKTSNESLKINTNVESLIVFGNGNIELHVNNEIKKFDGGKAARFMVKNGEIRFLTYEEFLSLNKGKSW